MKDNRENLIYLSFINDKFDIKDEHFANLREYIHNKDKFNKELQIYFDKKLRNQLKYDVFEKYILKLEKMRKEGIEIISIFIIMGPIRLVMYIILLRIVMKTI